MSETEKPLIVPRKPKRYEDIGLAEHEPNKAILVFLPLEGMVEKFCENNGQPIFLSPYWNSWVRDDGTMLVGPIFGGPLCSVIVEELSVLGVQKFIGYGASGALDPEILPGSIMIAGSSFCSDGTSKEYSKDTEVYADHDMLQLLLEITQTYQESAEVGRVWTTDAIYRELPSKVAYWKQRGARYVNLETGSLYSVAKEKGLQAVYLSAVSDCVTEDRWSGWFEGTDQSFERIWSICLKAAEIL